MKFLLIFVFITTLLFASVDINTASAKELSTLKGIGKKKAAKIIKYRKKHCFKNLKQLKKVKGFKKKKVKKILKSNKGNISIGECIEKEE